MRKNNLSILLGFFGLFFILFTVVLSFRSISAPVRILSVSEEAQQLTDEFMESVSSGDYSAAGAMVLGQPELEPDVSRQSAFGRILWDGYSSSFLHEFDGGVYISDGIYYRDVDVRVLDISGVMTRLKEQIQPALEQRALTMDRDLVCDEQGTYREEFVMETMCLLAQDLLNGDPGYVTRKITLKLVHQEDRWWICLDQSLVKLLSGGV